MQKRIVSTGVPKRAVPTKTRTIGGLVKTRISPPLKPLVRVYHTPEGDTVIGPVGGVRVKPPRTKIPFPPKTIGPPPTPIGWSRPFPLPSLPSDAAIPPERRDEFVDLMNKVLNRPLIHTSDTKRFQEQVKEFGLTQHFNDLMEAQQLAYLLSSGRPVHTSDAKRFQELVQRLGIELSPMALELVDRPVTPRTLTPKTRRTKGSTRKSKRLSRFDYMTTLKGFKP